MSTPLRDELQLETVVQLTPDQTPPKDGVLVDLGRVSDTQGGVFGPKLDNGAGFQVF